MSGLEQDKALLRELVRYAGATSTEVARKARVAPSTLNRPYNGTATTRLSQRTLERLREAYPKFPGWSENIAATASDHDQSTSLNDTVELDQIDLRYGMGAAFADGHIEVERRPFSREWLRSITTASPRHLFWAIGEGDSMEPTIRSGEVILIERTEDKRGLNDRIWALRNGDITMVKRVRFQREGKVELLSDNPAVPPEAHPFDHIELVGRVIAVVRNL